MSTIRLTMAQALVKFLDNQYVEVDGQQSRFVAGVFTIYQVAADVRALMAATPDQPHLVASDFGAAGAHVPHHVFRTA
ncbi:hypothetical protein BME99_13495 [Pseudomonas protegens]|nr:hypothetical protein BME99_13495 [Pseudomonas protegens]